MLVHKIHRKQTIKNTSLWSETPLGTSEKQTVFAPFCIHTDDVDEECILQSLVTHDIYCFLRSRVVYGGHKARTSSMDLELSAVVQHKIYNTIR